MRLSIVVAAAEGDVIGRNNSLPWHIPEDFKRFKRLTHGGPVIIGRKTQESILERLGQPLPGRYSIIVSGASAGRLSGPSLDYATSINEAVALAEGYCITNSRTEAFVAGGASIYAQAMHLADRIYLTRVHTRVPGDSRMPEQWLEGYGLEEDSEILTSHTGLSYQYLMYARGVR